jgi:CHAT domain-containing protein/tetratricopeptide (TPR) repeat protein
VLRFKKSRLISEGMLKGNHGFRLAIPAIALLLLLNLCSCSIYRRQSASPAFPLEAGKQINREIDGGSTHTYLISVSSDRLLRVVVKQSHPALTFILTDPDSRQLVRSRSRSYGATPISIITVSAGIHHLAVVAPGQTEESIHYELNLEEPRPATAKDKNEIAAEAACAIAEEYRAEGKAEYFHRSIEKYNEALELWRDTGNQTAQLDTLKNIGDVYYTLSDYKEGLGYHKLAHSLSLSTHDDFRKTTALNDIGYAYIYLGDYQKALEHCQQALELSRLISNRDGEAQALNNLGETQFSLSRMKEALDCFHQSLAIWQSRHNRQGQAQVLLNIGYVYGDLGEIHKSLDSYQQALTHWRTIGRSRGQARTLTAIGGAYNFLGEHQNALQHHQQALEILRDMGDRDGEAATLNGIGYLYEGLGEKGAALNFYDQSWRLFEAVGNLMGQGYTIFYIGNIHGFLGNKQKSLECHRRGLQIARALKDRRLEAHFLRKLGDSYSSVKKLSQAIHHYKLALDLSNITSDARGRAYTFNSLGQAHEALGERQKALNFYKRALSTSQAAEELQEEVFARYNIARVERDRGQLKQSRVHLEASLKIIEEVRNKVASQELRTSYFASIQNHYSLYVDLLMMLHRQDPDSGLDAAAFLASERARARSLIELLTEARAQVRQGADPELLKRARSLQQQINAKAERRGRLLSTNSPQDETEAVTKEIDSLIAEHRQVESQIRLNSPHYAALTQLQPISLQEIRQLLDDQTILLEYEIGSERSYLWVITPSRFKCVELPNRAAIEKVAIDVYKLLTTPHLDGQTREQLEQAYWRKAAQLSRMILGEIAGEIGNQRLLIVADEILQYIPFQALPDPRITQPTQPRPLMIDHEIVNLPSASTLAILRRETAPGKQWSKTIAVFADPVFQADDIRLINQLKTQTERPAAPDDSISTTRSPSIIRALGQLRVDRDYRRLYSTKDEAEAIISVTDQSQRTVWTGFDANLTNATDPHLSQYRIIHFATHGDLDTEHPELSAIVLSFFNSQGRKQEAHLRLHNIYNLNLPADLIVLSACETALGKEIKGEGLIGLTRGFMYAGAGRVMASLWKVEDKSTAELMSHFYRCLLKNKMTPAAALRQAQIEVQQQPDWRLPYHWAGFVLQGEWINKD